MRTILRQLLMALAHCHGQGVTHRNLKPKYVLLQPREVDAAAPDAPAAPAPRRHEATATPPPPPRGAEAEAARWRWSMGGARARAEEEGEAGWWVKLSDFNSVRWLGAAMAAEDDPIYGAAQATRMGSSTSRTRSSTSRTNSSTSRTRSRSSTSRTSNLVVRVGLVGPLVPLVC